MNNIEKTTHVKVAYNPVSTLVLGYYPSSINYSSIPEPFIQIENDAQVLDKQMCVVDGVYQEYVQPLDEQLQEARTAKLAQLKNNLINAKEGETPKKGSLESYQIDGVFRTFKVKISDLATIVARVSRLEKAAVGTTAQWTDIDGNRLDLNLQQFESLRNHLDVRDQTLHMLYEQIKSEIKACTTLEQIQQIEINF